jgi:hypothetical protein
MKIEIIGILIGIIMASAGAYVAVDQRYAHADEVKKLEMRLDQKILEDRSKQLQERMWKLEDRAMVKKSKSDVDEYRNIQVEKSKIDFQIKAISDQAVKMGN